MPLPIITYTLGNDGFGNFFFQGSDNLIYQPLGFVPIVGGGFTFTAPDNTQHSWQVSCPCNSNGLMTASSQALFHAGSGSLEGWLDHLRPICLLCCVLQQVPPTTIMPMTNMAPAGPTVIEGVGTEAMLKIAAAKAAINDFDAWGSEQAVLGNDVLATVAEHMSAFTDQELYLIPNVYLRGDSKLYVQFARDQMRVLRVVASTGVVSFRDLITAAGILSAPPSCIGCLADGRACKAPAKVGCVVCKHHKAAANDWMDEQANQYAA
jgi:hypothetical protein